MNVFLLTLALAYSSSWAGLEKLTVENLDLHYVTPSGKGMVDKVGIGMSLTPVPYPIEIRKTESRFELTSPYVDFTWVHPLKFIYDLEEISTKKMTASLGTKRHFVESEYALVKTKGNDVYEAHRLNAFCEGGTRGDFDTRLLEDCVRRMEVTIKRIEVPDDFILNRILKGLTLATEEQLDRAGDNFSLKVVNGDFGFEMFIKNGFYAGLRANGLMQFEDDYKILAIRIDQIKFGYLPITSIVMKKLKEIVKNPDVTINPPWIRIKTLRLYENQ
jgi:hypothetical protein